MPKKLIFCVRRSIMCKKLLFLASLVVVLGLVSNASAVQYNWTDANDVADGPVDGDWMDPCNWSPTGVPGFNDSAYVYIPVSGGTWPHLDEDAGTVGQLRIGNEAGDLKMFVETGGNLFIDETSSTGSPGDCLVGNSTGYNGRLVMTGGSLGGFDNFQLAKRAVGAIHLADDDVNDAGGDPYLYSISDGYIKVGDKDGGTRSQGGTILLDNGVISVGGLHFYEDASATHYMDIAGGTLEAGPERLGMVKGYYPTMLDYIEHLHYDPASHSKLDCYGGSGELETIFGQPNPGWVTAWCTPRDPTSAGLPYPKKRANVGPYENTCPNPAGSSTKLTLKWDPGATADDHKVYLSDVFADVNEKKAAADKGLTGGPNSYVTDLDLSTTYYWRVVEYNSGSPVATSPVWNFNVPHCLCIDDFESYATGSFPGISDDWSDDLDDALLTLSDGSGYHDAHGGTKSANLNASDFPGGNDEADIYLQPSTITDWTYGGQAVALTMWYKSPAGKATHIQIDVDGAGFISINPTLDNCWHETNIKFSDIPGGAANMQNVGTLTIRVGVSVGETGFDSRFDDIAVCEARCVPSAAMDADLDEDCDVDGFDLSTMGDEWLKNDANLGHLDITNANIGVSGPNWVNDPCRGWCLQFDGIDDNLDIEPDTHFGHFYPVTCAAWINRIETGVANEQTGYVFYSYLHGYRHYWALRTGRMHIRLDGSGTVYGPTTIPKDEWHHVAWVVDEQPCTGLVDHRGYLDASLEGSITNLPAYPDDTILSPNLIGSDRTSGQRSWALHAKMQDFRIYDGALTQQEILYLATDGLSGVAPTAPLKVHYPMNQSAGTTVSETSPLPNYHTMITPANIVTAGSAGSEVVNLKDYEKLARQWMTGPDLWP